MPDAAAAPDRPPASVDDVLALVRAAGGRVTPSRRILVEVLFESDAHRSTEDLAAAVQDRAPDVHLSTIYRNLDELQRLGVVVHTHEGHGPATYHLASSSHAHLVCEGCGRRIEAVEDLFAELVRLARERHGFTVDPHHFAVLGRCQACTGAPPGTGAADVTPPDR